MRRPAPKTFELGLVMAGAVSAGAYTAGVLDFLFEALDAWEQARREHPEETPDHRVEVRVITGTSAGGIAAGLAAMLPFTGHHPIRDLAAARDVSKPRNAERNLLYRSWVRDIDLVDLLATGDLGEEVVPSLLNGDAVEQVAAAAVAEVRKQGAVGGMPYLANPLQLFLHVTNLRGVPYLIDMVTDGGVRGHRVVTHADLRHFAVYGTHGSEPEGLPAGATEVNWRGTMGTEHDGWSQLSAAALATSAFPVGLPSRYLQNDLRSYESRPWAKPAGADASAPAPRVTPDLAPHQMHPYTFWSVDGGLLNNEPLETARVALSGAPDQRNPREPDKADRAVLMIDPFPDDTGRSVPDLTDMPDMLASALALLPTLKNQARFKPDEVMLALHEDVYSRFLIVPRRPEKPPVRTVKGVEVEETDIASAGLGGFAGFIDSALRMHDFQLGRRNAQKFLRDHLVVHRDNEIVRDWVRRFEHQQRLGDFQPLVQRGSEPPVRDPDFVQLIPLFGTSRESVAARPWPRIDCKTVQTRLRNPLDQRTEQLTKALVRRGFRLLELRDSRLRNRLIRNIASQQIRNAVRDKTMEAICEDFRKRGLSP
jgi:hypothetical protein